MKNFKEATNIIVGGGIACIVGGIIYKKLKDIHEEIIYFEFQKGVYNSKKEKDDLWKRSLKNQES